MSDLISRQEALIAIMDLYPGMPRVPWLRNEWARRYEPYIDAEKAIRRLPSAEPEPNLDEWCTDCKEYDHERHCCPRWNRVIREAVEELKKQRNCEGCRFTFYEKGGDDE